jgi:hypothetical protein
LLEPLDLHADCGVGYVQMLGGALEATGEADSIEGLQQV